MILRPLRFHSTNTPAIVAVAAAILVYIWLSLTVTFNFGGNWTALFCIGFAMPPDLAKAENLHRFPNSVGYDGQFYHLEAHDPFFTRDYTKYIDAPRFRYRRIGLPLLTWLAAAGQQPRIDATYIAVAIGFIILGVYWLAQSAFEAGLSVWLGMLYLLIPSSLVSMDRMITDGVLATLCLGTLRAAALDKQGRLWILCALACLVRETGLCLVAGYALWYCQQRRWGVAVTTVTASIPLLLWEVYISAHTAPAGVPGHFAGPFYAIVEAIKSPQYYPLATAPIIAGLDRFSLLSYCAAVILAVAATRHCHAAMWVAAMFGLLAVYMSSRSGATDFIEVYNYGRVYGSIFVILILSAFQTRNWRYALPLIPIVVRTGLPLAWQAYGVLRSVASA